MDVHASSKSAHISPRKARLVANAVVNIPVDEALRRLSLIQKRGADILEKILRSAIANAVHNAKLTQSSLIVKRIEVNQAEALKRFKPSTRGRTHPYKKRRSIVRIVVGEGEK